MVMSYFKVLLKPLSGRTAQAHGTGDHSDPSRRTEDHWKWNSCVHGHVVGHIFASKQRPQPLHRSNSGSLQLIRKCQWRS